MPPEAITQLINYGVLGIMLAATLAAAPGIWKFFEKRVWRNDKVVDKKDEALDRKDTALLRMTETTAAAVAVNTEVIKQNSKHMQNINATHVQLSTLIHQLKDSQTSLTQRVENGFEDMKNELRRKRK